LDDLGRKAMALEGNWDHLQTVAGSPRVGHAVNVSMPVAAMNENVGALADIIAEEILALGATACPP